MERTKGWFTRIIPSFPAERQQVSFEGSVEWNPRAIRLPVLAEPLAMHVEKKSSELCS